MTQELVERLNERASRIGGKTAGPFDVIDNPTADLLRAAASCLSELQDDVVRLREALASFKITDEEMRALHSHRPLGRALVTVYLDLEAAQKVRAALEQQKGEGL